jgi:hypothetical protein
VGSIIFAAFLFGGVLLYGGQDFRLAYIFWGFSAVILLWIVFFSRGHSPWR